jgi:hypothetical protein
MPVSSVTGLDHLEGETVGILADGSVLPQQVVANGKITLQQPASKIIIGLPYVSDGQTLNIDTGEPTTQGKRKKIPSATLRVERTRGLKVGTDFNYLTEIKMRTTEPMAIRSSHSPAINSCRSTPHSMRRAGFAGARIIRCRQRFWA